MRPLHPSLAITIALLLAGDLLAQTTQPLMKLTVKDGKIVKTESIGAPKGSVRQGPLQTGNRGPATSGTYEPNVGRSRVGVSGTSSVAGQSNPNTSRPSSNRRVSTNETTPFTEDQNRGFAPVPASVVPKSEQNSGKSLPQRVTYASAVLDGSAQVRWMGNNIAKPEGGSAAPMSTTTIMTEGYEGVWPAGSWSAYSNGYDATWDDVNYRYYSGSWSAWCAAGGAFGVFPQAGSVYSNDMDSWMVYGPFDLSDAGQASLALKNYLVTETNYDYFKWMASTDGVNFFGYQADGNSGGWVDRTLDLTAVPGLGNVTGLSQVWIGLGFHSDYSITYEGSYVDDVLLTKTTQESADLYWTSMALSTDNWAVGSTVTASLTVANGGAGSADYHWTSIYMSPDTDINPYIDTQLGYDLYYPYIAAGSEATVSLDFTVPPGSGTYYLSALVDYYGYVTETDEGNNGGIRGGTVYILDAPPDLISTAIDLNSDVWLAGVAVTATVTENNYGESEAASHYTRLYLSDNTSISDQDVLLGYDDLYFGPIASGGGSQQQDLIFDVPDVADGTYYVGVIVDYYDDIIEGDESNNTYYRSTTVDVVHPLYIDLEGYSMGLSTESWGVGASITAYFTEYNNGTLDANAHSSRLYLSSDEYISEFEDALLGGDLTFSLMAPGATQQQESTFTVPVVANGTYYVGAYIDYYNDVSEMDEEDNIVYRISPISVLDIASAPDLVWTSLSFIDDTWSFDEMVMGQLTVANIGLSTAGTQESVVYLSTNDIISDSDTPIWGAVYDPIDAGSDQLIELLFYAPAGDGEYWVGALVDVNNEVPESDELNNGGARINTVFIEPDGSSFVELAATFLTFSTDSWTVGGTVIAELTEENYGTLEAGSHHSRLVLSDNITISESDLQLGLDLFVDVIQPGTSGTGVGSFDVPEVTDGEYYIGVFTDVLFEVVESNESNNIAYRYDPIYIQGSTPDILVTPSSLTINETSESASTAPAAPPSSDVHGDYVPNQMIVKFKSNVGTDAATMRTASSGLEGLNTKYKVKGVRQMGKTNKQMSAGVGGSLLLMNFENGTDIGRAISDYKKLDIVEFAEPNYIVKHTDLARSDFDPSDSFFGNQWGLKNTGNAISYTGSPVGLNGQDINVTGAWDITMGSPSIIVAVIDDGVDVSHPEFSGRLVDGYDFVNDDTDPSPLATDGHGNACAGIIGAGNDGVGVIGVAPGVKIMPVKAMQDGSGFNSDIIDGVYFAVDNGAKVISMSLGGTGFSSAFEAAVNYAVSHGVVVLSAAGNDNEDNLVNPHYPASYANSISVGAMSPCGLRKTPETCDGEFWWGSNYGNLDFITPGTRIYTTDISGAGGYSPDGYSTTFNGTSAATPFAAGVAALILSVDPTLTPAQVRQIMAASAVDVGDAGYDAETGNGRLDALAALQLIQGGGIDNQLIITNAGQSILAVTSITSNSAWLTVSGMATPFDLNASSSALLTVDVDWTGLVGANFGEITIESNDPDQPTVIIPVTANAADVTIYTVQVSAYPADFGTVVGSGGYGANQQVTLNAIPAPQREFINWTENGEQVASSPEYSFTVTGGRSLVANFQLQTYTIFVSADPGEAGLVTGEGLYEIGQTVTLTAEPLGNYGFVNWTENNEIVSLSPTYVFTANANRVVVAHFSHEFFEVTATANPPEGGTVTGAGTYLSSQTASMSAQAASGYSFNNWTDNSVVVSTDPNYIFTVTSSRALVANFIGQTRTINVTANPILAGSVSGGGVYNYGATATLQATPTAGNAFVNWTLNGSIVSVTPNYSFTVTVNRDFVANFLQQQIVTFEPLADRTFGNGSFALIASSTSGLPVSFSSSNPAILAISGSTATILNAGTVDVTATQTGNIDYGPAIPVVRQLIINKANQTISFASLSARAITDGSFNLTATASSGLTVTYESGNQVIATVANNVVTFLIPGTVPITAYQDGNDRYNPAPAVTRDLVINKANQSISFATLATRLFSDGPFNLNATASSGLTVVYESSNTIVANVVNNVVTPVAVGSTMITAYQYGDGIYNSAPSVSRELIVNKGNQTISFGALPSKTFNDPPFQLAASSSAGLSANYSSSNTSVATINGNMVTIVGAGTSTIQASHGGNSQYNPAASVQQTLTVGKASQSIAFGSLASVPFSPTTTITLNASSTSGLAVSYSSTNLSVATVSGNTVTLAGAGSTSIIASQAGNNNYNQATNVPQTLSVQKGSQTITFDGITDKLQGGPPFELVVSVSSGLPLTITTPQTTRVSIANKTVTILQPGPVTITAAQPGNTNYNAAASRSWEFCVNPAKPTITLSDVSTGLPKLVSSAPSGNQWFKNGTAIPGATGQLFATTGQADAGSYTVKVTVETCEGVPSDPQSLIVTGLQAELATELLVYPNPFDTELRVDVSAFGQSGDVVVNMYDMAGKLQRTATGTGLITLDVSRVSSGAYILQVQSGEQILSRKVFKVR